MMTNANYPLTFWTDSVQRMRLYETRMNTIIQGHSVNQSGYLGVSNQPLFFTTGVGPFSRVHLVDSCNNNANHYAQQYGFRPWMKNGITFTGNQDQGYMGQKYSGVTSANDSTDMVIQWSDNDDDSPWPTDRLRFIFTDSYNSAQPTGARSLEGQETFRIFVPNDTESFVGIGDFYKATYQNGGIMVDPDERLDVLDRTVRIRQLPDTTYRNDSLEMVVVVDSTDGRLYWRYASTIAGGAGSDCDWIVDPDTTGIYDICTAYAGGPCLWDSTHNVGIGMTTPFAKLDIVKDVTTSLPGPDIGIRLDQTSENWDNTGVDVNVHGTAQAANIGGRFEASNAGVAYGVQGFGGSASNTSYGVYGEAISSGPLVNYGVYGYAAGGSVDSWSIYSQGRPFSTAGASWYFPSDATLKTNIEDIDNAMSLILQLALKSYDYDVANYDYLSLPAEHQYGLLAQEVEAVLPELVTDVTRPAELDADGNVVNPQLEFKAMKYDGLIPLLIAAVQEQNARIDQLEEALSVCCGGSDDGSGMMTPQGGGNAANGIAPRVSAHEQLRIQPNPFSDGTSITYTLEAPGQVRLIVSTSSGKQLRVLEDAQREEGTFTYEWNTTDLASGVYNVMLLVDGAPLVQKAVKIER